MKIRNQLKKAIGYVLLATPILAVSFASMIKQGFTSLALELFVLIICLGIFGAGFHLIDSSKRDD